MISIIIPVKNRNQELKRAIDSVLKQTVQDSLEIIVVDDKSEMDINSIVGNYNDPRLVYVLNDKDISNANVCRNLGFNLAKGDYIAMLDSDDEWLPNHLEQKIKFLEENNCEGVFGSYYIDDTVDKKDVISRSFKKGEVMINYLLSDGRAATPTQVYKTYAAKSIMWDEALLRHQDFDFSVRFAEKYSFLPSNEVTCIVHWGKGEKRLEDLDSQIRFIKKHKEKILPRLYNEYHSNIYLILRKRKDVGAEFIDYFKKQSSSYIHDMTLNEFLALYKEEKGKIGRSFLRIKYLVKTLFN